jgi:hypothetical protein
MPAIDQLALTDGATVTAPAPTATAVVTQNTSSSQHSDVDPNRKILLLLKALDIVRNQIYAFIVNPGVCHICHTPDTRGVEATDCRRRKTEPWKGLSVTNRQVHDETAKRLELEINQRCLHILMRHLNCAVVWAHKHPLLAEKTSRISFEYNFKGL